MSKNRVDPEWTGILKNFADQYWDKELNEAHELFNAPYPSSDDTDYIKKTTFLDNAKRNKLQMLKAMAQSKSGAIHPVGANNMQEKGEAAKLLEMAQKRINAANE